MSSFDGVDLFGSGPHRASRDRLGQLVVSDFAFGGIGPDGYPVGLREPVIVVTGRLVGASEAGLRAVRAAVEAKLTDPPQEGDLVTPDGHTYAGYSFVEYDESVVDRGRVWSVFYRAVFRKFNQSFSVAYDGGAGWGSSGSAGGSGGGS